MIRHKYIDAICIAVCIIAVLLTVLFINGESLGLTSAGSGAPYQSKLFDDSQVHTLDIVVDAGAWQGLLANAQAKEYLACDVLIDGEAYRNVAIRTKGNSTLSTLVNMDSDRYSFKIEFDHYDNGQSYYGLDKLSLNNTYQDTTYLKDYLSYHMMNEMGIAAPLSSFVQISLNGELFGLYLAVEGVEESLIERYYGKIAGKLYKPDSMQMGNRGSGGGRDNSASLLYTDDNLDSYSTIWDGAVFDITEKDQQRLVNSLQQLNAGENLAEVVDIEAVLKYFVAHNFVVSFDSYTGSMMHNYYLYEQDGRLALIPWDYNLAFGSFSGGMGGGMGVSGNSGSGLTGAVNYPIDTPVSGTTLAERPLLGKLLEVPEYLELYHLYFEEFIAGYFTSGRFAAEYDQAVALIAAYVQNDPTAFYTYEQFEQGTAALKEFCLLRAESVRDQLNGSIPATSEGQAADASALIDASHLSQSSMGSMGGGGGGMGGGGRGGLDNGQQDGTQPQGRERIQPPGDNSAPENQVSLLSELPPLTAAASLQIIPTLALTNEADAAPQPPDGWEGGPPSGDMPEPPEGFAAGEGGPPAWPAGEEPAAPPDGQPAADATPITDQATATQTEEDNAEPAAGQSGEPAATDSPPAAATDAPSQPEDGLDASQTPEGAAFPTQDTAEMPATQGNEDWQNMPFGNGGNMARQGGGPGGGAWPGNPDQAMNQATGDAFNANTLYLLLACVIVLALGYLFVLKYRKF